MFKKLPQELLTEANEALQAQVQQLRAEMYMRAAPRIAEMMTALNALTNAAEKGDQSAKQLLAAYFEQCEKAKAAASGIVIPPQGRPAKFEVPENPNPKGWSSTDESVGRS